MSDGSRQGDWAEAIKGAIANSLDGLHTAIPAKVLSYLAPVQQCAVEPVIAGMPELDDVPVLWPRGGGYYIHLPLAAGDHVLLVFCERDFGPWRLSGLAMAPAQLKRHGLFAYAVPGAAPDVDPLLSPSLLSGAAIGEDGPTGNVVQISPAGVTAGPAAGPHLPVGTAVEINAQLNVLKAAIAAAPTVPTDGGAAFKAALVASLAAWPSAIGSTVLGVGS
jgi:hypothetical protein